MMMMMIMMIIIIIIIFFWLDSPQWAMALFTRFLDHTNDTPHSVGLLWMSDQLFAETST